MSTQQPPETGGPGYELCLNPHYAWLQNLFRAVPFARGYLRREKMREADILIRRHVASLLDEAARSIDSARQALASAAAQAVFASQPMLSMPPLPSPGPQALAAAQQLLPRLRGLYDSVQRLSSDILYADSGWAPVGAVQAIREDEIRLLCSVDDSMIGLAEAVKALASRLEEAARRGDASAAEEALRELEEAVDKLRGLYEERRRLLRFASTGRTVAGEAREAVTRVVAAARGLLSRLASKLGLGRREG